MRLTLVSVNVLLLLFTAAAVCRTVPPRLHVNCVGERKRQDILLEFQTFTCPNIHKVKSLLQTVLNTVTRAERTAHVRRNYWSVGDTHFSQKNCVSPAGRVCMYSSLILSTFFSLFFSSSIAVFFIAKPSSIVVFVVQTKWTFNHEGRGHRSLIGVSRGIGRPHRDTLGFSEYKIPYARC